MSHETIMIIIEYMLRILVLVIGTYAIKLIKQYKLQQWVDFCVRAAEQIFNEPGLGKEKKEYVIQQVLKRFNISREELDILIEASVEELNRLQRNLAESP